MSFKNWHEKHTYWLPFFSGFVLFWVLLLVFASGCTVVHNQPDENAVYNIGQSKVKIECITYHADTNACPDASKLPAEICTLEVDGASLSQEGGTFLSSIVSVLTKVIWPF